MSPPPRGPAAVPVPKHLDGRPLDGVVRELFEVSWGKARDYIASGKITIDGDVTTDERAKVHAGAELELRMSAPRRPRDEARDVVIVHLDAHVVVVAKPSGISTIPFDETEKDTLDERVRRILSARAKSGAVRPTLGVVHRIDKETSGLVVFTRSWLAKQSLASQFRAHTVHRRYLAIVHGDARKATYRTHLVADRGDGLRGSIEARGRNARGDGQLAITHVEPVEKLRGATLVACRLETGRTHQIRVHLSEAGHPLLGERVYIRGFAGPVIAAPRLMLHAAELGFVHPKTEAPVRWELPMPDDMRGVVARLGGGAAAPRG